MINAEFEKADHPLRLINFITAIFDEAFNRQSLYAAIQKIRRGHAYVSWYLAWQFGELDSTVGASIVH